MRMRTKSSRGKIAWLVGRGQPPGKAAIVGLWAKLVALPVIAVVGFLTWMMFSDPSDAESQMLSERSPVIPSAQNTSWFNPVATATESDPATPAEANTAVAASPIDGLKISSQSWRRGGLGSKALVTFTLRNRNDYAVKDIEIFCAFTRSDGTHLTDRKRMIPDIVKMKSQRTFARMHVGFVNVNANRAKCSLLSASRI